MTPTEDGITPVSAAEQAAIVWFDARRLDRIRRQVMSNDEAEKVVSDIAALVVHCAALVARCEQAERERDEAERERDDEIMLRAEWEKREQQLERWRDDVVAALERLRDSEIWLIADDLDKPSIFDTLETLITRPALEEDSR